jgi:hypothetical protein
MVQVKRVYMYSPRHGGDDQPRGEAGNPGVGEFVAVQVELCERRVAPQRHPCSTGRRRQQTSYTRAAAAADCRGGSTSTSAWLGGWLGGAPSAAPPAAPIWLPQRFSLVT